ncbi:Ferric reductase transmembrane component 5 [Psilocybe cubensis]|uniref:ferric-chelate reductase (NADPH) n=2 Tax=Psilocybe cubensis TaxID=181762 RepID=A0A8H7XJR3_PSICU|nr:Ferric reductase transmembrane component 5 [Psilocybe cubensis]KAH9483266.1 Ferric reductase transmembrane component 5 [Psilocybe cubensis]
MSITDAPILSSRATSTAADRLIRNHKQVAHVRQLWIFLGSVLAFLTLVNVIRRLVAWFTPITEPHPGSEAKISIEKINDQEKNAPARRVSSSMARRGLTAVVSGFKIFFFRWRIPFGSDFTVSVIEQIFIVVYIVAMLIWLLVDTRNLMPMMYQDRAALIASSQIPLIVALAGKNNVISWLTGVSHEKLNVLHRAAARTNFMFFWIHAGTRIHSKLPKNLDLSHNWMRSGAISLTALTLATILSIRPIRRAAFEFFLIAHIILIFIFIVAGYYHARELHFGGYIWPGLLVWGFDRTLRFSRTVLNGRFWNRSHPSDALVELVSEDTIRLTMRREMSWTPGQHAYVVLPSVSNLPFEAHPFTIASIPEERSTNDETDVVFLIRGRDGLTKRLRELARKNHGYRVPALLDGPYGMPPDLRRFTTCVLIAGGSGISYTLPLLLNLARINAQNGSSAVRRIVFIWAIRDTEHLRWISRALTDAMALTSSSLVIDPRIYITGKKAVVAEISNVTTRTSDSESLSSSGSTLKKEISQSDILEYSRSFTILHGRPNLDALLNEEIQMSPGQIAVNVAGPSNLAASVRRTLSSGSSSPMAALKGIPSVSLHIETFGS